MNFYIYIIVFLSGLNIIPVNAKVNYDSLRIQNLWEETVAQYLQDTLWNGKNVYDAGHYLMVPLHYAFITEDKDFQADFRDHFRCFSENYKSLSGSLLGKLHYMYLLSRYLVLASENASYLDNFDVLIVYLQNELKKIWEAPAWMWDSNPFPNMKQRIHWKMRVENVKYSYYKAILDEDLFVFAIAADLVHLLKNQNKKAVPDYLNEILLKSYDVYSEMVRFNKGHWYFQQGVWADHPDFFYAGQFEKKPGMNKRPVNNITWDSSHSHRFPMWLKSMRNAYDIKSDEYRYYDKLINDLACTFLSRVYVPPDSSFWGIRLNNYMNGHNGIYRWNYPTQGENNGYGPFELSGTFFLGWWSFLKSDSISNLYEYQADLFPLKKNEIIVYVGPNTSRERNPLVQLPDFFFNGYAELILLLSSRL